jgi:NADH:ubiquinone oxidoreductase subunit E
MHSKPNKAKPIEVELCLGSACYSRGNGEAIDMLEEYVREKALEELVSLKGRLCAEQCAKGPCIHINGKLYTGVKPECVVDLLRYYLEETQ